jgi:hypothetical protein
LKPDHNEYLPSTTLQWCTNVLRNGNYLLPITASCVGTNGEKTHRNAYLYLTHGIKTHLQDGNEAKLALCEEPIGALSWEPRSVAPTNVLEAEFLNEGCDP